MTESLVSFPMFENNYFTATYDIFQPRQIKFGTFDQAENMY